MNKLELIETLRKDTRLTRAESKAVIKTFFGTITDALVKGNRVEIRGLCSFMSRNIKRIPEGILKPESRPGLNRKSYRFLSLGRN